MGWILDTVNKGLRSYRENSKLYIMLEKLKEGECTLPDNPEQCFMFEIACGREVDATFYDNRFYAFSSFLEELLWVRLAPVGTGDSYISVYFDISNYNTNIQERILDGLHQHKLRIFHEMKRCELTRVVFQDVEFELE